MANGTLFIALPGGAGGDALRLYSGIGALIADEAAFTLAIGRLSGRIGSYPNGRLI